MHHCQVLIIDEPSLEPTLRNAAVSICTDQARTVCMLWMLGFFCQGHLTNTAHRIHMVLANPTDLQVHNRQVLVIDDSTYLKPTI